MKWLKAGLLSFLCLVARLGGAVVGMRKYCGLEGILYKSITKLHVRGYNNSNPDVASVLVRIDRPRDMYVRAHACICACMCKLHVLEIVCNNPRKLPSSPSQP